MQTQEIGDLLAIAEASREALPLVHPDRPPYRYDLPNAWKHFRNFIRDKDNTQEVFWFFEALPWVGVVDAVREFLATERGQYIYRSEPYLPDILDDHEGLRRRYPKDSLAWIYCDFMEAEGLSAAGLVAVYDDFPKFDDKVQWFNDRLRDTHDLLHILTDIGRDTLGEACLGAYMFKQRPSVGHLMLGYAGCAVLRLKVKSKAPFLRAAYDSRRAGKAGASVAMASILELLPLPIEEARARLNVKPSKWYHEALRVLRSEGYDPQTVLAKAG